MSKNSIRIPPFGFINGLATLSTFLPFAIILFVMLLQGKEVDLKLLTLFICITRFISEWVFWTKMFPEKMDSGENVSNWRSYVKNLLFSHPICLKSLFFLLFDIFVDIFLFYVALKTSAPYLSLFLVYVICQAISAPIQGVAIYYLNRKHVNLFSTIATVMAMMVALGIDGMLTVRPYIDMLGLSHFTPATQILIVLAAKSFFSGTSTFEKAEIAEVIKLETSNQVKKSRI